MQPNPIFQAFFEQLPQWMAFQPWRVTPDAARAEFKKLCEFGNSNDAPIGKIEESEAPGPAGPIRLRIYTPVGGGGAALPAILYFHGGGFVLGDLDCYDALCRTLANESGCRLIAVEYRLAPEHPFPAALDDCLAALQWVETQAPNLAIDPNRIAVAGDSSGGNLAAVVCQLAKTKGNPHIAFQLLIYPIVSLRSDAPSAPALDGFMMSAPSIHWIYGHYVPKDADSEDPRLSPLRAKDFSGLPPAYIVTAGFDPFHDDGVAYAKKLSEAGVAASHIDYPAMIHGFFGMQAVVPSAGEAVAAAGRAVREALT